MFLFSLNYSKTTKYTVNKTIKERCKGALLEIISIIYVFIYLNTSFFWSKGHKTDHL